jgi:imidazolonepropionase-like amidohydrolase/ABC-type multidrug transport system permease subunit
MNRLRGWAALTWALLLETWRSKPAIFWNLVFPLFTLIGFSYIFGRGQTAAVARVVPGTMTINLLAASFFGISLHMVSLRERDVYRRMAVTPLTAPAVVLAHAVTALVNIAVSSVLQLGLAVALFHIHIAGSLLELAGVLLVGAFAFIPLGLLVGSIAQNMKTAPALSNLLFFPLTFLSGASMPLYFMPAWVQRVAEFLPATYFVELLQAAILRGRPFSGAALSAGILILTGIVGFAFNAMLFRWESRQPIRRRNFALAVACLAVIYTAAYARGVKLQSANAPNERMAGQFKVGTRILTGMTIIDGSGGRIQRGRIVLEGNRIVDVGPEEAPPKGVPVTDLSGSYVIPGLIDSHIHLGGSPGASTSPDEYAPSRLVRDTQVYLALGITSFVSLTDHLDDMQKLQGDQASGAMRSPRPFISGPGITAPGGHPAELFSFMDGLPQYMTRQVATPEAAEQAVRHLAADKVDIIKLFLEEGWPGNPLPVLCDACLVAGIRTAKELGLRTTVHVDNDRHARMAIEAGVDGIEHVPPDLSDQTIHLMVAKGITLTPTIGAFDRMATLMSGGQIDDPLAQRWVDPMILETLKHPEGWLARYRAAPEIKDFFIQRYQRQRAALRMAVAAHVTILAGSDAGNPGSFHGPGLIHELELLVTDGGMTPSAAIVSATGAAAKRLGKKEIGQIAAGAFADLVVLEEDPEKDIRALRNIRTVYLGGVELDRDKLLTSRPGNWSPLFNFPDVTPTPSKPDSSQKKLPRK